MHTPTPTTTRRTSPRSPRRHPAPEATPVVYFNGKPAVRAAFVDIGQHESVDAAKRLVAAPVFAAVKRVAVSAHRPAVAALLKARGIEVVGIDVEADVIVSHAVAATRGGKRCGFGSGETDLRYAMARIAGHPAVPVVTTVQQAQLVKFFPTYEHDVELSWIATADELIEVPGPVFDPTEILWDRLEDAHYAAIKALRDSRDESDPR